MDNVRCETKQRSSGTTPRPVPTARASVLVAGAALHADTPSVTLLDRLGRPFVTIAHNGLDGSDPILFQTHVTLDIEGNPGIATDANGIPTEANTFAPGGLQLHTSSPDAGQRWALADDEKLQTRTVYGESLGLTAVDTNHRGQVYRVHDSAGALTALEYDFKGNLLANERRLAIDYTTTPDWIDLAAETDPVDIETAAAAWLESETSPPPGPSTPSGRVTTQTVLAQLE